MAESEDSHQSRWLERFHAGHRETMEDLYQEYFSTVENTVSKYLTGLDMENVVHEVFFKILSDRHTRTSFNGGSMSQWIIVVARNLAIDYLRRDKHEKPIDPQLVEMMADREQTTSNDDVEISQFIERIRKEVPDDLIPIFDIRFVRHMNQRDAAKELGMSRTTLAKREKKIREKLRRFLTSNMER